MKIYYLSDDSGDIIGWDKKTGKPGFYRGEAITAMFESVDDAYEFIKMLETIYNYVPDLEIVRL